MTKVSQAAAPTAAPLPSSAPAASQPVITTPARSRLAAAVQVSHDTLQRPANARTHTRFFDDGSTRTDFKRARLSAEGAGRFTMPQQAKNAETTADVRGSRPRVDDQGGPVKTDAHFHPTNYSQRGMTPRQTLQMMDQLGIRNSVLMPIPTTIIAPTDDAHRQQLPDHHCGHHYYIPEQYCQLVGSELTPQIRQAIARGPTELMMETQVDHAAAARLKAAGLSDAERSRLDPMVTGLHLGGPISPQSLLEKLKQNPGTFTGIGEITIHKELVEDLFAGKSQANLATNIQSFKDIAQVAGLVGMPLVLHCDVDDLANNASVGEAGYQPSHLAGLKRLFQSPELKDTHVVWAHAGGLGRFVAEPGASHTAEIQSMLDANPKLHVDISWSHVANQMKRSPEALDRWADLINANPNRFLIGSDSLSPQAAENWNETFQIHSDLMGKLSGEAREKLLNGNYERVFVAARPKVREFEDKVLTDDFEQSRMLNVNGPRVTAASIQEYIAENNIQLTPRS